MRTARPTEGSARPANDQAGRERRAENRVGAERRSLATEPRAVPGKRAEELTAAAREAVPGSIAWRSPTTAPGAIPASSQRSHRRRPEPFLAKRAEVPLHREMMPRIRDFLFSPEKRINNHLKAYYIVEITIKWQSVVVMVRPYVGTSNSARQILPRQTIGTIWTFHSPRHDVIRWIFVDKKYYFDCHRQVPEAVRLNSFIEAVFQFHPSLFTKLTRRPKLTSSFLSDGARVPPPRSLAPPLISTSEARRRCPHLHRRSLLMPPFISTATQNRKRRVLQPLPCRVKVSRAGSLAHAPPGTASPAAAHVSSGKLIPSSRKPVSVLRGRPCFLRPAYPIWQLRSSPTNSGASCTLHRQVRPHNMPGENHSMPGPHNVPRSRDLVVCCAFACLLWCAGSDDLQGPRSSAGSLTPGK